MHANRALIGIRKLTAPGLAHVIVHHSVTLLPPAPFGRCHGDRHGPTQVFPEGAGLEQRGSIRYSVRGRIWAVGDRFRGCPGGRILEIPDEEVRVVEGDL